MMRTAKSRSERIRAGLDHPIIDSDGHIVEFEPLVLDYLQEIGGSSIVDRYKTNRDQSGYLSWHGLSAAQRTDIRATRTPWWGIPAKNTLDRGTIMLPELLYQRLDEMGLDFTVLYPTLGFIVPPLFNDEELRGAACRAFNCYYADLFKEYSDRIAPVAVIPMHTPKEAIAELEYSVETLGFKAVVMAGPVLRPIPSIERQYPGASRSASFLDTFCIDSEFDYDPVWAKCEKLKVVPTFHASGMGWGSRTSISNYMYNHIGNFAAAGEAMCKSLFMGGVTRRFPNLKFAFLEGGVGWACSLYADLIGHWEKRNIKDLENYNPDNLNKEMLLDLFSRYGGDRFHKKLDQIGAGSALLEGNRENPASINEWTACQIDQVTDIANLFVPCFYFGCEADDPVNTWAFNTKGNPFGSQLNTLFGSDIGHWDVPDIADVVGEAYEPVEKGLISEMNFKDFVFTNPASFYASLNTDFFKGTIVEGEVKKLLSTNK